VVARPKTGSSSVLLRRCCLGSRIERRIILEHAEHDHGELARQRHLRLVDASASGDPHRPAFEFRASLDRLGQHEVGNLGPSREFRRSQGRLRGGAGSSVGGSERSADGLGGRGSDRNSFDTLAFSVLADPLAQTPSIAARVDCQLEAVGSNQEDGRWQRIASRVIFAIVQSGFGADVRVVMERRTDHRASGGLARGHGQRIIFARDLIEVLRRRQLEAASARLSAEKDEPLGRRRVRRWHLLLVCGAGSEACSQSLNDGFGVQLVSWRPALGQHLDRPVSGVITLDGWINWSFWAGNRIRSVMLDAPRPMLDRRAMVRWPRPW
jgi:hypothetical protein